MMRFVSLFLILVFPIGCIRYQVIPSAETIRGMRQLQVIAMGPPAVEIPTTVATSHSLEELFNGNEIWMPSSVLADEVTRQIAATGRIAVRVPGMKRIPVVINGDVIIFDDSLRPMRKWYNSDRSFFDYHALGSGRTDAVVEVALALDYSVILENRLIMHVMMRLIDPSSGKIIGRVRAYDTEAYIGDLNKAVANEGARFKQVFTQTGRKLIARCLSTIGLLESQR